jgi:hypothetical protein
MAIITRSEMKQLNVLGTRYFSKNMLKGVSRIAKKPPIKSGISRLLPIIKKKTNTMINSITERAFM